MKFKNLEMTGFKSFSEKTTILIEKGLTGIVGPNGCGKSNIVEALRWCMGENSAKSMRGSGMEDVIFSGTSNRPSKNISEVALLLDNIEKNSNGRISIEIFPSMTLGGRPPELVQQARDGVVDIIWTVNGYTPGMFPRSEVFELPTVFINDPEPVNLALFDLFEADLKPDYAGLQVMFLSVHAGNAIHMRNEAIRSPTDLAGKK